MILPFTLQQLRILKAVANERSFTRAAEILYVSQPSLSKQIKILENKLGIVLLNRENSTISLTEGGRVFLQYSERILALCEESCRALNDVKNGDRGNLTVGASQTIGTYLMPRVLALFAQNYPQINIKVQVDSTRIVAKNVVNREIDIAVVGGDMSAAAEEVDVFHLMHRKKRLMPCRLLFLILKQIQQGRCIKKSSFKNNNLIGGHIGLS